MIITLKDGSQKEFEGAKSVLEIARELSEGLAKVAILGKVNGELVGLDTIIDADTELQIITSRDEDGLKVLRHTCSHILAQAVKRIFPTVRLAIGPAIANGFYYDFDFKTPISLDEFGRIEKEMESIIKADFPIKKFVLPREEAIKYMREFDENYKVELIEDLPDDAVISFYQQGDFVDLCAGPHLRSTGMVKAFKLTSLTGAYWKGNEKNKMLTRIYGTAFEKKAEMKEYLALLEEAKKRDHNKLGRELNFFTTNEDIGQGLPLLMPKGAKFMQTLVRFVEDEEEKRGYVLTKTPYFAKSNLYKISGHWSHYKDGMFVIGDEEKDDEVFALRPMTCPFQYAIYNTGLKSYRDLPYRMAETSTLFRNESSGEMHGLIRVRQFTLSEGHIVCTPSQVEDEFKNCVEIASYMLKAVGLADDISFRFSKWDPNNREKYIDDEATWTKAEAMMEEILGHLGIKYSVGVGEAAFYGPKLDIQIKNVWGKEDTLITIQVDMFLAENFDMTYVDENGDRRRPYIIHRSSLGCYERTMALLIEKYAGALPLWMSPVQVKVISLTDRTSDKADEVCRKLREVGVRVEVDNRSETIGYKIRSAQLEKIPYMAIIGDKEAEAGEVSLRNRKDGNIGQMKIDDFIEKVKTEIKEFKID